MEKKISYNLEIHKQISCQKSLTKNHLASPKEMQQGQLFFFCFLLSFLKGLLQVVLSFTKVKPEIQVWSVTREQPQQAVEFGLSTFRRLEAI